MAHATREADVDHPPAGGNDDGPRSPVGLPKRSWLGVLRRTIAEFRDDNLTDWAAALTYYGILSIFPGLLVFVSVIGLIGQSATQSLLDNLGTVAPGPAKDIVTSAIRNLQDSQGAAGVLLVVGLAGALWSASGYVGAFMRASNAIYEVEEGRPFWKLRPLQLVLTLMMVVLLAAAGLAVVFTGGVAEQAGKVLGVGSSALDVWDIAKWPVIVLAVAAIFSILYYAAPNVRQPGFRWLTPGGLAGVLLWIVASVAFAFYVANFGSYNKTYGTLGGVIVFLVWMWISNVAVLLGAELNAEVERGRELEAGMRGADRKIQLEPRAEPKAKT